MNEGVIVADSHVSLTNNRNYHASYLEETHHRTTHCTALFVGFMCRIQLVTHNLLCVL